MSNPLQSFQQKPVVDLRTEMVGFSPETTEALLRFQKEPSNAHLRALMPGFIAYHLSAGTEQPPAVIGDDAKLIRDLGLDSLALSEMAFKMEDVFGFRVETHEVFGITTFGELLAYLTEKLQLS